MIFAIKKQGESNERLISRFKKLMQRSRVLMGAKHGRFHKASPTKRFVRQSAIIRSSHRKRRQRAQFYS